MNGSLLPDAVCLDIETTGLKASDEITAIGYVAQGVQPVIHYQDKNGEVGEINDFTTFAHESEESLIESLHDLDPQILAGHNITGFDIKTLRTRSVKNGITWPFGGTTLIDTSDMAKYLFNTTRIDPTAFNKAPLKQLTNALEIETSENPYKSELVDAVEAADVDVKEVTEFAADHEYDVPTKDSHGLDSVYDLLIDGSVAVQDPFERSEECVEAFHNGDIDLVVKHNANDVLKNWAVFESLTSAVPSSEIRTRTA